MVPIGGGAVQIGSGRRGVQLTDCDDSALQLLDRLAAGVPDGTEVECGTSCGMQPPRAQQLLDQLAPVLTPFGPQEPTCGGHRGDLLADDLAALAARPHPVHHDPVRRRRDTTVQVIGLGRTGAVVAQVLASAGLGHLVLDDPRLVTRADLGTTYRSADLGRTRAAALSRRLESEDRGQLMWPAAAEEGRAVRGDLTVVVARGAVDRDLTAAARAADHPLLPVVVRDDDVLIGPWALPGVPGCPGCWELWESTDAPPGSDRAGALAAAEAGWEESALSAAAGALAAAQVLSRVDAPMAPDLVPAVIEVGAMDADGPRSTGQVMRLSGDGSVQTTPVRPHLDCGCLWAAA